MRHKGNTLRINMHCCPVTEHIDPIAGSGFFCVKSYNPARVANELLSLISIESREKKPPKKR